MQQEYKKLIILNGFSASMSSMQCRVTTATFLSFLLMPGHLSIQAQNTYTTVHCTKNNFLWFPGLFVSLYAAVERLLLYQDQSNPAYSSKAACRCILLHEFCPALHTILEDGLKVNFDFLSYLITETNICFILGDFSADQLSLI